MGISVVRVQDTTRGICWGVVEDDVIFILEADYASHRELMDSWFSHPAAFKTEGLPRIAFTEAKLESSAASGLEQISRRARSEIRIRTTCIRWRATGQGLSWCYLINGANMLQLFTD